MGNAEKVLAMRTIATLIFTGLLAFSTLAQNNDVSGNGLRAYGASLIYLQSFHNGYGLFFGGKGAAFCNAHLSMGGLGLGSYQLKPFRGDDLAGNTDALLRAKAGYAGLFLSYAWPLASYFRINAPLQFLWGRVNILNEDDNPVEKSGQVVLQPSLELELYATKRFIPTLRVAYNAALGSQLHNLSNADFSGWSFGLEFRFAGPAADGRP